MLSIAFQTFLSRMPLAEVDVIEVVVEVMRCTEYFILYAVYSIVKANLTSLLVMVRSTFKHSLIALIKNSTPNSLILASIIADNVKR